VSRPSQILSPPEVQIVLALAQTMYPRDGGIPIDGAQARAVEYVDAWLALLPARERHLVRMMFVLFEVGMPVFGPDRTHRFSTSSPEQRTRYLQGWESSRLYFRRASMFALRSVLSLAYLGDSEVQRRIGVDDGVVILARQRRAAEPKSIVDERDWDHPNLAVLTTAIDSVRSLDRERREAEARAVAAASGGDN
jgi:hypothetical protein